jgi:hypothetical protein
MVMVRLHQLTLSTTYVFNDPATSSGNFIHAPALGLYYRIWRSFSGPKRAEREINRTRGSLGP